MVEKTGSEIRGLKLDANIIKEDTKTTRADVAEIKKGLRTMDQMTDLLKDHMRQAQCRFLLHPRSIRKAANDMW